VYQTQNSAQRRCSYPDCGNLVIVVESHRWTAVLLSKALRQGNLGAGREQTRSAEHQKASEIVGF